MAVNPKLEERIKHLENLGFIKYNQCDYHYPNVWSVYWEQINSPSDKEWKSYLVAVNEAITAYKNKPENHKFYGAVEYTADGLLVCHICGRAFRKLAAHTVQKHFVTAEEYKEMYGLYSGKGLVTEELRQTLSDLVDPKVIQRNLINKGAKTRYKKGKSKGRTKVVPQLKNALIERLKAPAMKTAMQESGKRVGLSGTGNKARWSNKSEEKDVGTN